MVSTAVGGIRTKVGGLGLAIAATAVLVAGCQSQPNSPRQVAEQLGCAATFGDRPTAAGAEDAGACRWHGQELVIYTFDHDVVDGTGRLDDELCTHRDAAGGWHKCWGFKIPSPAVTPDQRQLVISTPSGLSRSQARALFNAL